MLKFNSFLLTLGFLASQAASAAVLVQGRSYSFSCGYYSNQTADLAVTLRDHRLPWGTKVKLIYGWEGTRNTPGGNQHFDWDSPTVIPVPAVAPYTWTAKLSETIAERGSARYYEAFDFVFEIDLPDGKVVYEKGGSTELEFYRAELSGGTPPCVDQSHPRPAFSVLPIAPQPRE